MTPIERIQIITELKRAFPSHKRLHEALSDYEVLAIEQNRYKPGTSSKPNSRAAYMREHRKKERELIRQAKALEPDRRKKEVK